MKFLAPIFIFLTLFLQCPTAFSQQQNGGKVQELFFRFIEKKLALTPQESSQMRPLLVLYFRDMRKIQRDYPDILVREQQKVDLKIKYRKLFEPIIGMDRSTRFFVEEQIFRKKVRDELKQRKSVGRNS